MRLQIGTATVENSMEVPQKTKNWSTIWSSFPSTGYLPQRLETPYLKRYLHNEIHSNTEVPQDTHTQAHKSQINNLNLQLKELENEQQTKPKASRRKTIIQIRAEMNEIMSKAIQKINNQELVLQKAKQNW